ncbi:RES family NAD+ phosphorylase [Pseudomonas syringae]|nr:RES family NAD+ phosphorylase [Pseudomonas syringae]
MKAVEVEDNLKGALKEKSPFYTLDKGALTSRVQLTRHENPLYYNGKADSNSRYAHIFRKVGVLYVARSPELAIAESFQHGQTGPGSPVLVSEIVERSLHQLEAVRPLKLVDIGLLLAGAGYKPRDVVQAKGQGSEGYFFPQMISTVCMEHSQEIDGLYYGSSVYAPTGSPHGCNIVLFEGREPQLVPVSASPLMETLLTDGSTAVEFLMKLNVIVE